MRRIGLGAAAVVALVSACTHRLDGKDREEGKRRIEAGRAEITAIDLARRSAVASTTLVPREDLGKCPIDLGVAQLANTSPSATLSITSDGEVVIASELATTKGARLRSYELSMAHVLQLDENYESKSAEPAKDFFAWIDDHVRMAKRPSGTLVVDALEKPKLVPSADGGDPTYQGGALRGRFYVYDPANEAIVCASKVDVSLHGDGDVPQNLLTAPDSDELVAALELDALRAAMSTAVKAGPATP